MENIFAENKSIYVGQVVTCPPFFFCTADLPGMTPNFAGCRVIA
jgi:hypothetical protein